MGKIRIIAGAVILLIVSALLSGCTTAYGTVYGKREVLKYVDSRVKEKYKYVSRERIHKNPDDIEYTFSSMERDLEFTADSYLSNFSIDGCESSLYTRQISCSYVDAVKALYDEEINELLGHKDNYNTFFNDTILYVDNYDEISDKSILIEKANKIYSKELKYNDEDFLTNNSQRNVDIKYGDSTESCYVCSISIDGQRSADKINNIISNSYCQSIKNGLFTDYSVPEDIMNNTHVSKLSKIYVNERSMFNESYYSADNNSYMIRITPYCKSISDQPAVLSDYVSTLNGTCINKGHEKGITWKIKGDTWVMKARYKEGKITAFSVTKNGKDLDIQYYSSEKTDASYSQAISLKVEDFAKLFNLSYNIDENNESLNFYSD